MYKTARNLAFRTLQKRKQVKSFRLDDLTEDVADSVLTEEVVRDNERNRVLHLCLDRIDPMFREALWLVYFENMSYLEAAAVMRVSRKKIDNLLTRGKQHMKKELKKEGITNAYG